MTDVTEARVDSAAASSISVPADRSAKPRTTEDPRARLRLPYLDGMRAVAATYVVMFHAVPGFAGIDLTGKWRLVRAAFGFGHEAVAVFIVLSGYCLMLPVARAEGEPRLGTSFAIYVARRAFRILPPYFAAAGLTLLAIATLAPLARTGTGTIWDQSLPAFEPSALVTHALLVHNWVPELAYRINGPHWSVATEWQIYFFFPLLLLPIWRRFGVLATGAVAGVVGYAPIWLWPRGSDTANPWYLLLFVLGMTAASIGLSRERPEAALLTKLSWRWISSVLWAACLAIGLGAPRLWFREKAVSDLAVGLATAALLVYLTQRARSAPATSTARERGWLLTLLEWRPVVALGHLSYSLYLTHLPVVALCYFALHGRGYPPPVLAALTLASSLLASLLVAYPFHLLIERPFMTPPRSLRSRA